jgi:hypothetical protein
MNKCIIAISGTMKGKAMFQEIVENKMKLKIKGADCDLGLQEIISQLGWDGETYDKRYYDFYNTIFKLSNDIYDFKHVYLVREIENFQEDEEYQILALKGSNELEKEFEEEVGVINILIAKNEFEYCENALKYDWVILMNKDFENSVKQTLDILLKKEKVNA